MSILCPRCQAILPAGVVHDTEADCKAGGVPRGKPERRVSDAVYRASHRAQLRAYQAARYQREREKFKERARVRRSADPEGERIRIRAWRLTHPDQARAQRRRWLAEDPLRAAAVSCAITANGRAQMYGIGGRIGYAVILDLWSREPVCVDCGIGRGLDHVVPLSRGGANQADNLANRCDLCNKRKGVRMPAQATA